GVRAEHVRRLRRQHALRPLRLPRELLGHVAGERRRRRARRDRHPRLRRGRAAQRHVEHEGDRERHRPPHRHAARRECGGRADREHDANGRAPVVADDEVPPESPEGDDVLHARTSAVTNRSRLRRRSAATKTADSAITKASTPNSAASEPGQLPPAPSVDQKIPNVVSITPTANLSVFSGTRARGGRTANPTAATSATATPAPSAASGMLPCVLPNVSTMNATSRPSSSTPLNESVNPYQSTPPRSRGAAVFASASSREKISSSSCSALNPLARRIALRSHCSPNVSRRPPTTSRNASIGMTVSAGPSAATIAASTTTAAPTPVSEERQPRATPEASTMVSASTPSTALARNAERTRKTPAVIR